MQKVVGSGTFCHILSQMWVCFGAQTLVMIDKESNDELYGVSGYIELSMYSFFHLLFPELPYHSLCRELLNDSNFHTALQRVKEEPIPFFKQFSSLHSTTHTDQQQTTHSNLKEAIDQPFENTSFFSQEGKQVMFSEEKRERQGERGEEEGIKDREERREGEGKQQFLVEDGCRARDENETDLNALKR